MRAIIHFTPETHSQVALANGKNMLNGSRAESAIYEFLLTLISPTPYTTEHSEARLTSREMVDWAEEALNRRWDWPRPWIIIEKWINQAKNN